MFGKCQSRQSTCEKIGVGQWSFIGPGSEKKFFFRKQSTRSLVYIAEECCWNSQTADILPSVQQLHCPGVSSRAKDVENCRYTLPQMITQLTFFCIILSVNQVSVHGAVAALCEEFENHQDGSGEPEI